MLPEEVDDVLQRDPRRIVRLCRNPLRIGGVELLGQQRMRRKGPPRPARRIRVVDRRYPKGLGQPVGARPRAEPVGGEALDKYRRAGTVRKAGGLFQVGVGDHQLPLPMSPAPVAAEQQVTEVERQGWLRRDDRVNTVLEQQWDYKRAAEVKHIPIAPTRGWPRSQSVIGAESPWRRRATSSATHIRR